MGQHIIRGGGWETGGTDMDELLELHFGATGDPSGCHDHEWKAVDKTEFQTLERNPNVWAFEIFEITDGKSYNEHEYDADHTEEGVRFVGYFTPVKKAA